MSVDFLLCKSTPELFAASDPINNSTRVPPDTGKTLSPGRYFWRVAPLPVASALKASDLLSDWSAFNSFTIYPTSDARIQTTQTVRVGTNLEQNTPFSHLDEQGRATGLDISLIYTLVEQCLRYEHSCLARHICSR